VKKQRQGRRVNVRGGWEGVPYERKAKNLRKGGEGGFLGKHTTQVSGRGRMKKGKKKEGGGKGKENRTGGDTWKTGVTG